MSGYLSEEQRGLLVRDPGFAAAVEAFDAAAWDCPDLEPRFRELLLVALTSATTTLHEGGMRLHMQRAIETGATVDELVEILELVSVIGIHSCAIGVPMLVELLPDDTPGLRGEISEDRARLKDEFVRERGYWSPLWDGLLRLAPDFFRSYLDFSAVPWRTGPLSAKEKELVYLAVNASTTHLYLPGLRQHLQNARDHGATAAEISGVLRLAATLGLNSLLLGHEVLGQVLAEQDLAERDLVERDLVERDLVE